MYGFVYNYVLHGEFLRRAPFFFFASASFWHLILLFFFSSYAKKKKGFWSSKKKKKDNAVKRALNRKLTLRWNARGIRCEWAEFHVITIMVNSRDQRFSFLLLKRTSFFSLFSRLCQRIYKRRFARKNQTAKEKRKKKKNVRAYKRSGEKRGFLRFLCPLRIQCFERSKCVVTTHMFFDEFLFFLFFFQTYFVLKDAFKSIRYKSLSKRDCVPLQDCFILNSLE